MSSQKWHPRKVVFLRSHGGKPRLLSAGNTTLTIISYLNNGNWNHVETSAHQCTHSTPGSDCKWRAVSQLSFFTFCFLPQFTWGWEGALTFGWVHPRCTTTPSTNGNGQSSASPPREHHFITFELRAAEARAPWKLSSRVNIAHKYQLFIGKQHQRESWCWSGFFFTWKRENNSCFIWMLKKKTTNLQNLTLYRVSRQAFFCPSLGRVQKCTRV